MYQKSCYFCSRIVLKMRKYLFFILLTLSSIVSAVSVYDCDWRAVYSCAQSFEAGISDNYSDYVSEIVNLGLSADNTIRQEPTAGPANSVQCKLQKSNSGKYLLNCLASLYYKSLFLKRLLFKNSLFGGCRFLYLIRVLRN